MKSPLVLDPKEKIFYSNLKVMKSNAGYYIGSDYTNTEHGFIEPGTRDSPYYANKSIAEYDLTHKLWKQRLHA